MPPDGHHGTHTTVRTILASRARTLDSSRAVTPVSGPKPPSRLPQNLLNQVDERARTS